MRRLAADLVDARPGLPLYAVSAGLVALALVHVRLARGSTFLVAEVAALLGLSVGPLVVARQMDRNGCTGRRALRVASVATLGGVYGASLGVIVIGLLFVESGLDHEPWYGVFVATAAGFALGAPVGYYYDAFEARTDALEREVGAVESLNKRLHVTRRALRHNLRNELTVLYGIADELAAAGNDDAAQALNDRLDNLDELSENTHRLARIWDVDGTVELDVGDLLASRAAELRASRPAVDVDDSGVSSVRVRVHPHFGFAVEEALDNAVTHNDPEEVAVEVGVDAGPETATVTIADDGSGIPSLDTGALDQEVERPLSHGRGLGLWIIYWAVEASGGEVRFDSDDGAVVQMTVPRAQANASASAAS